MVNTLDVLDFVVTQIKTLKLSEGFQAFDVRDEIVIEFEVLESGSEGFGQLDGVDGILSET